MKNVILPFLAIGIIAPAIAAGVWETNMDEAKKKASEQNKGLFIEFTGSDWCGPCIHFKKTVLSKDEFLNEVQKHFILVELDYPRQKEQRAEQKEHNAKYAKEYGIKGYPTVIFANSDGKPVYSLGERDMKSVLKTIEEASAQRKIVDQALAELPKATKEDRVKLISSIFDKLPIEWIDALYGDFVKEVKSLPGDPAGYVKKVKEKEQAGLYGEMLSTLEDSDRLDPQKAYDHVQTYLDRDGLSDDNKQNFLALQAEMLVELKKVDAAIKLYQKALDVNPDSSVADYLAEGKAYYERNKEDVLLSFTQKEDYSKYKKGLDKDVSGKPASYAEAVKKYLAEKDATLVPSARIAIVLDLVNALGASDQTDGVSKLLEEQLGKIKDEATREKRYLGNFREFLRDNKDRWLEQAKKMWEASQKNDSK